GMWRFLYVGFQDRVDPDGKHWKGVGTIEAVLDRMKSADAELPEGEPLVAWGFDPIFLMDRRPDKRDFDTVSATRPIAVMHSNFHLMTVNSAALKLANYTADLEVDGIARDADGDPNGELQEVAAMFPVMRRLGIDFRALGRSPAGVTAFGQVCKRAGVTTAADLINDLPDEDVNELLCITARDDYPIRLASMLNAMTQTAVETGERALALQERSTDKLILGGVKIVTDGSIQGFTARLRWPGYYNGASNGIWNVAPEQLNGIVAELLSKGVAMHIHVNGDEAIAVAIDAVEAGLRRHAAPDHRTVLQHCQMADRAQFEKMRALGLCVNLFANHIFYFGDQHAALTIGPDRARRMDACRTALDFGVPMTIHSDAPVTPLGPLTTAWAAVNRLTASGTVLGEAERISVPEALHAITLGAAYSLHMDDRVGSVEVGKFADFTVLDDDPLTVDPGALRDIPVWGTVLGGDVHPV
ncbi:MAG: amidohydrolase, partial [Minwuiales bacterium]|nr:amidohydrolase [Minwuiales bacterium]